MPDLVIFHRKAEIVLAYEMVGFLNIDSDCSEEILCGPKLTHIGWKLAHRPPAYNLSWRFPGRTR